jgi:hypothetical protein
MEKERMNAKLEAPHPLLGMGAVAVQNAEGEFAPTIVGGYGVGGAFGGSPKSFRTDTTGGSPVPPAMIFDVSRLISRGLEQKRSFFDAFLTLNHFDFS